MVSLKKEYFKECIINVTAQLEVRIIKRRDRKEIKDEREGGAK
jgi:hypothetical protein